MQQLDSLPSPTPVNPHLAGLVRQFHRAVQHLRARDAELEAGLVRVFNSPRIRQILKKICETEERT
jgi:hypothetical protein